jgi:hypothetical protein
MVNEELIEIIRNKYQQGERKADIKAALIEQGYEEADIETAISHIQHDAIKQLPVVSHMYQLIDDLEQKTDHASPKFVATVLACCFGVLLILFGGLYLWLDPLGIKTAERDKQRETDVVRIRSAVDQFYIAKGIYPANLKELLPTYLQAIPLDPKSGAEYTYRTLNEKRIYELCINFEASPSQCVTSQTDSSIVPMVIITPTPMQSELTDLEPSDEASTSPDTLEEEAPAVNPTAAPAVSPGGSGTGDVAL